MPRGPKGERRPADVIGNAVHVMRVLTGEIEETIPDDGKDPAAKALGKKGKSSQFSVTYSWMLAALNGGWTNSAYHSASHSCFASIQFFEFL